PPFAFLAVAHGPQVAPADKAFELRGAGPGLSLAATASRLFMLIGRCRCFDLFADPIATFDNAITKIVTISMAEGTTHREDNLNTATIHPFLAVRIDCLVLRGF
ncbi:MAG TPA: hypothetical protein VF762_00695, partial [Blastocatellia bacterium]